VDRKQSRALLKTVMNLLLALQYITNPVLFYYCLTAVVARSFSTQTFYEWRFQPDVQLG
jgi:hypothetical protein